MIKFLFRVLWGNTMNCVFLLEGTSIDFCLVNHESHAIHAFKNLTNHSCFTPNHSVCLVLTDNR